MIPQSPLFTGPELASLQRDIKGATRTGQGGSQVTYKQRTAASTRNFGTGAETPVDSSVTVGAVFFEDRDDQGGGAETGEVVFLIDAAELVIQPGAADVILSGTRSYEVLRAELDPTGSVWVIDTREEGTK